MLGFYLSSVIVWMIIIYCMMTIFKKAIIDNGWAEGYNKSGVAIMRRLLALFVLSAIPVFRVFVLVAIMYMATHMEEEFDKWREDRK